MSLVRAAAIVVVVTVTLLVAPAAEHAGINAADLIVCAAPLVVVAIGLWPRRAREQPAWIADIDEAHAEAISRVDGVAVDRHSS